ncbi:MAG: lactonase family protein [Thaumarchaeota archaeon]|nr:lactonase family protein [Nitrososphaerota archaeon]
MKVKIAALLIVALFAISATSVLGNASALPTGSVYAIDNRAPVNSVLQFASAPNGGLSLVGNFSTQGAGTGTGLGSEGALALTQNGRLLLVVDAGSNEITAFHVNHDGSLTFADKVGSQGTTPISLAVGQGIVYVLNAGGTPKIAGFSLGSGGQLTFIAGSVQPLSGTASSSPEQIGFAQTGDSETVFSQTSVSQTSGVLIVTEKGANIIDTYTVGRNGVAGAPTVISSNGGGPYGFAFAPNGDLILSEAGTATLSSYAVSDSGNLRTLSGAIPDFGLAPCWVAVSPDGRFAYTSNAHGGTISGYSLSGTGTLSLFSSVAAKTSIATLDLTFSGNGHFLFVLNGNSITTFQTYQDGSISRSSSVSGLPASVTGLVSS